MLQEISSFRNLGSPNYFFELANLLAKHSDHSWSKDKIDNYFYNRQIDGKYIFDGCIFFANQIGLIDTSESGEICLSSNFIGKLDNYDTFTENVVHNILSIIKNNSDTLEAFSASNVSYDLYTKSIKISNKLFAFKYSQLKQLLLDFDILETVETEVSSYYVISKNKLKLVKEILFPDVKLNNISPETLRSILERQAQNGLAAEEFVFKNEKKKLNSSKEVIWVAEYSVSEGYDIASFNSDESQIYDRFIEVKSYSEKPSFYWSINEIICARDKGNTYYLLLVDSRKLDDPKYQPFEIKNPYVTLGMGKYITNTSNGDFEIQPNRGCK